LEPTRAAQIVFWASLAPKTAVGGAHIEVKLLCQLCRHQIFHYHLQAKNTFQPVVGEGKPSWKCFVIENLWPEWDSIEIPKKKHIPVWGMGA